MISKGKFWMDDNKKRRIDAKAQLDSVLDQQRQLIVEGREETERLRLRLMCSSAYLCGLGLDEAMIESVVAGNVMTAQALGEQHRRELVSLVRQGVKG